MFDKNEYKATVAYYAKVILIAVIPIILITLLIHDKVSPAVEWVIDIILLLIAVFIGIVLRDKINKRKEEKKEKRNEGNYDPFK